MSRPSRASGKSTHAATPKWEGSTSASRTTTKSFSQTTIIFRYENERHLPACIEALNVADKKVLEIGLGEGSESERLIRAGARWSGVDLTSRVRGESPDPVDAKEPALPGATQGSVLDLPFPDSTFDVVFSHGVLHHVPDIRRAQSEIHRVLRPAEN